MNKLFGLLAGILFTFSSTFSFAVENTRPRLLDTEKSIELQQITKSISEYKSYSGNREWCQKHDDLDFLAYQLSELLEKQLFLDEYFAKSFWPVQDFQRKVTELNALTGMMAQACKNRRHPDIIEIRKLIDELDKFHTSIQHANKRKISKNINNMGIAKNISGLMQQSVMPWEFISEGYSDFAFHWIAGAQKEKGQCKDITPQAIIGEIQLFISGKGQDMELKDQTISTIDNHFNAILDLENMGFNATSIRYCEIKNGSEFNNKYHYSLPDGAFVFDITFKK